MKVLRIVLIFVGHALWSQPHLFVDSIEKAVPAVVFILNEFNSFDHSFEPSPGSYVEWVRPFYEFLWPPTHYHGSGFIISEDGYIVTNAHCVGNATETLVILGDHDFRVFKGSVVGIDERTDLAVLKIDIEKGANPLPTLSFGDSDAVLLGDFIALIGNPLLPHLQATVTRGSVSGKGRGRFHFQEIEDFLQIDAAAHPGSSGGPVINSKGEVVGVVCWGIPAFGGLNFAIPSQIAQKVVKQLIDHGKVSRGYLGITLENDLEVIFDAYEFSHNRGAKIAQVSDDSPAQIVGLREGDVMIAVDAHPISSAASFIAQLALVPPHEKIMLTFERDGVEMVLFVELSDSQSS